MTHADAIEIVKALEAIASALDTIATVFIVRFIFGFIGLGR